MEERLDGIGGTLKEINETLKAIGTVFRDTVKVVLDIKNGKWDEWTSTGKK